MPTIEKVNDNKEVNNEKEVVEQQQEYEEDLVNDNTEKDDDGIEMADVETEELQEVSNEKADDGIEIEGAKTEKPKELTTDQYIGRMEKLVNYLVDNGKDPDDINHVAVALTDLARMKKGIKGRPDENIFEPMFEDRLRLICETSNLPDNDIFEIYDKLFESDKPENIALPMVKQAQSVFFDNVKEEDRAKIYKGDLTFSKMMPPEISDIEQAAKNTSDEIPEKMNDANQFLKSIKTLHNLENAYNALPWYAKAWSAIKGLFTGHNESKAIDSLRNSIREASPYNAEMTEKAINAKYPAQLTKIVEVATRKLNEELTQLPEQESRYHLSIPEEDLENTSKKENELKNEQTVQKTNDLGISIEGDDGFEIEETPEEIKEQIEKEKQAIDNDGFEIER